MSAACGGSIEPHIQKALSASKESKTLDFKQQFDVTSKGEWCELLKDIVAMANSGGGLIFVAHICLRLVNLELLPKVSNHESG